MTTMPPLTDSYEESRAKLEEHQTKLLRSVEHWVQRQQELMDQLSSMAPKQQSELSEPQLSPTSHNLEGNPRNSRVSVRNKDSPALQVRNPGMDLDALAMEAAKFEKHVSAVVTEDVELFARHHKKIFKCFEFIERSTPFQVASTLTIFFNSVMLAITTENYAARAMLNVPDVEHPIFGVFELAFCSFYVFEIFVKVLATRSDFCFGKDMVWNIFDVLLTTSAVAENLATMIGGGGGLNMSYLRVIRVAKTLKLLRFIRLMRCFRELRMVLDSVLGSMRAMFWTVLLVLAIVFMFGIAFVQAGADLLRRPECAEAMLRLREGFEPNNAALQENYCLGVVTQTKEHWGGLRNAMLTLFQTTTGGMDWGDAMAPLSLSGPQYSVAFLSYIGFFLFAIMNALTSIFVDAALVNSQKDDDQIITEQMGKKEEYMKKVAHFFYMLNRGHGHTITLEQFMENKGNPAVVGFAESLEIESSDLELFFQILSANGSRDVDLETFVVGCIKLRGLAKSMDMMEVMLTQKQLVLDQSQFVSYCEMEFACLQQTVREISNHGGTNGHGGQRSMLAVDTIQVSMDRYLPVEELQLVSPSCYAVAAGASLRYRLSPHGPDEDVFNVAAAGSQVRGDLKDGWLRVHGEFRMPRSHLPAELERSTCRAREQADAQFQREHSRRSEASSRPSSAAPGQPFLDCLHSTGATLAESSPDSPYPARIKETL